jgi:hypothetical protein
VVHAVHARIKAIRPRSLHQITMLPIALARMGVAQAINFEMEVLVKRIGQPHKITYIRSDRSLGFSRFVEDVLEEKPLVEGDDAPEFFGTDPLPPGRLSFMRMDKGWAWEWHNAPSLDFLYMVEGVFQVSVGPENAVETRMFRPGDLFAFDDPSGRGHRAEALEECCLLHVDGLE